MILRPKQFYILSFLKNRLVLLAKLIYHLYNRCQKSEKKQFRADDDKLKLPKIKLLAFKHSNNARSLRKLSKKIKIYRKLFMK